MTRAARTPLKPARPAPKRVSLREDFHRGTRAPLRVDRDAGVIHRVKILGWESANKRQYLPEAARKALPLYDGAKAYADHPDKPTQMRGLAEALGIWRAPVWEADGVYADLHYFKTHPLAERVCEDAERGLGVFGASHNADGTGQYQDGIFVVGEITEVRSVDLVTEPATVANLWEGKAIASKVKTVLLEKVLPALKAGRARRLKALAERLPDALEMTLAEDGGGPDHRGAMYGAMRACEDADDFDSAKALHKLLAPREKEKDDDDEETEEGDEGDEADADSPAEEGRRPKRRAPGAETLTEARALSLCKAAGVEPTLEVTEALKGAGLDQGLAILTLAKRHQTPAPASPPRSAPRGGAPVVEGVAPKDAKQWAERLLG